MACPNPRPGAAHLPPFPGNHGNKGPRPEPQAGKVPVADKNKLLLSLESPTDSGFKSEHLSMATWTAGCIPCGGRHLLPEQLLGDGAAPGKRFLPWQCASPRPPVCTCPGVLAGL